MSEETKWPTWMSEVPTEFWTDEEVLEWLNEPEFPDCAGCECFSETDECSVPLAEYLDLECCYRGGIITPLEMRLRDEKQSICGGCHHFEEGQCQWSPYSPEDYQTL